MIHLAVKESCLLKWAYLGYGWWVGDGDYHEYDEWMNEFSKTALVPFVYGCFQ